MLQIIVFVLVLGLVYVVKAGAVMLKHADLAEDCASFSWVRADAHEEGATPIWATGETDGASQKASAPALSFTRRIA